MYNGAQLRTECLKYNVITILVSFAIISWKPTGAQSNITERIIGGYKANIKDYPSYVAIFNIRHGTEKLVCGGTYIHKLWVLTAEHCLRDVQLDIPRRAEDLSIKMGLQWLFDKGGQARKAVELVRHPRGHCVFLKKICDIGLIRINQEFQINEYAKLAKIIEEYPLCKEVVVVGYGTVSNSSYVTSLYLHQVHLTITEISKDTIHCVDPTPRGSCYGDSGGPMYSVDNRMLVGIISSGDCRKGIGVYVNVFVYRPWIFMVLDGSSSGRVWTSISLFIGGYLIFSLDYCIK